jgi:Ala-tRNA(Pro) deacylase
LNDRAAAVTVVLDGEVAASETVFCHPLTNDRTTAIRGPDLVRFLESTGHPPEAL